MKRKLKTNHLKYNNSGYSLINLIITLGIFGVLSLTILPNFKVLKSPLQDSANQVVSTIKLARINAISKTKSFVIKPDSLNKIGFFYSTGKCEKSNKPLFRERSLTFKLQKGVNFTDTSWQLCFKPQGFASSNPIISLVDSNGNIKSIEVGLAGGVQVL